MRDRSSMQGDPFSDMLKVANAESVVTGGFRAGGAWALRFPVPGKLKFFGIVKGACWLTINGEKAGARQRLLAPAQVRIDEGDVFLLSPKRGFVLAGTRTAVPIDTARVFTPGSGAIVDLPCLNLDTFVLGGHVQLDASCGALLVDVLPPLVHVKADSVEAPVLRWLFDQLVKERTANLPGSTLVSSQLAQLMFIQIVRAHIARVGKLPASWLRAVSDERIAPALRLMHGKPGHPWRVEELAKAAAMSRTTFAVYFKSVAGVAPLAYLAEWRMRLAARSLREETIAVSELARSLGYSSESAFSNAFKRVTGSAPAHYRSAMRAQ